MFFYAIILCASLTSPESHCMEVLSVNPDYTLRTFATDVECMKHLMPIDDFFKREEGFPNRSMKTRRGTGCFPAIQKDANK